MGRAALDDRGLLAAVADRAASAPDEVALVLGARSETYAELIERAHATAAALEDMGASSGDRVAVMMRNCPELFEFYFAAMASGIVLVPLNYRSSPTEISNVLTAVEPSAVVLADEFGHDMIGHGLQVSVPVLSLGDEVVGEDSFAAAREARIGRRSEVTAASDKVLTILLTGGTTGLAKGVMLTQRALAASIRSEIAGLGIGRETLVAAMPLFHVGIVHPLCVLSLGGTVVLHTRVDTDAILHDIERHRATMTVLLPTSVGELVDRQIHRGADTSSLRFLLYGAAPMHPLVAERAVKVLGPVLVGVYGLTEGGGVVCCLDRDEHDPRTETGLERLRSIGRPLPGVELACWGEDLRPVEQGSIGEIVVRGANVMRGYWGQPELTAEALKGGWLRTGDLGYIDEDGYSFLVDRKKNMIITGGENVYPKEVEDVLLQHPAVKEAAVVGLPDERWGEAVTAFIVLREGAVSGSEELAAHCAATLARYKKPRRVFVVPDLPRTAVGKLDKKELHQWLPPEST